MVTRAKLNHFLTTLQSITKQQGWNDYLAGHVIYYGFQEDDWIGANVKEGAQIYKVKISPVSFWSCSCNCNCLKIDACRHISAVLHAVLENSAHQLSKRIKAGGNEAPANPTPAKERPLRVNPIFMPAAKVKAVLEETGPIEQWHHYLEKHHGAFQLQILREPEAYYKQVTDHVFPITAKWKMELQQLFAIHVHLYLMSQFELFMRYALQQSIVHQMYHSSGSVMNNMCMQQMTILTEALNGDMLRQEHPALLEQTIGHLEKAAFQYKSSPMNWLQVYRQIWWSLGTYSTGVDSSKQRMHAILASKGRTHDNNLMIYSALLHLEVVSGQDKLALEHLQLLATQQQHPTIVYYLQQFVDRKQWARLLKWLRKLTPKEMEYRYHSQMLYPAYWQHAVKHLPVEQEWIDRMVALLPSSQHMYSNYLITNGYYKMWVDLQLTYQIHPKECDRNHWREVERMDPQLLLPWYHQAIEKNIEWKSRSFYKVAVYYLKKQRQIFKKIKQLDRWTSYRTLLTKKYTRQKAFLDEMARGGLLQ